MGGTINRIAEISASIAAAVGLQALATLEIADNVHAVTDRAARITANIGEVNDKAADVASASVQILTSAADKDHPRFKNEPPKKSTDSRLASASRARVGDQSGHRSGVKGGGA